MIALRELLERAHTVARVAALLRIDVGTLHASLSGREPVPAKVEARAIKVLRDLARTHKRASRRAT